MFQFLFEKQNKIIYNTSGYLALQLSAFMEILIPPQDYPTFIALVMVADLSFGTKKATSCYQSVCLMLKQDCK